MIVKLDYVPNPVPDLYRGDTIEIEALPYDFDALLQRDEFVEFREVSAGITVTRIDNRHFRVEGTKAGDASFRISVDMISKVVYLKIVEPVPTRVTVSPFQSTETRTTSNLNPTVQLTATVEPSNANQAITYSSPNNNIASVSSSGLVTAKKAGTVKIKATASNGIFGESTIVINDLHINKLTLDKTSVNLTRTSTNLKPTTKITATTAPSDAFKNITFVSDNTSIATVDNSGNIVGLKQGTARVTCQDTVSGKTAICSVVVTDSTVSNIEGVPSSKAFELTKTNRTLTYQIPAKVIPENAIGATLTYTTSNSAVASVSTSGLITAKKGGTATVSVKAGSITKNIAVTVTEKKLTSITGIEASYALQRTSNNLAPTLQLRPVLAPSDAYDQAIVYTSSNTNVATISTGGLITVKTVGSTTITIKNNHSNITKTTTINVTDKKVTAIGGVPSSHKFLRTSTTPNPTLKITASASPSDAVDKALVYSTSKASVATVDSNGNVRAVGNGTCDITVRNNASGVRVICKVTVEEQLVTSIKNVPSTHAFTRTSVTPNPTLQLSPVVEPSTALNKNLTYTTSDTNTATVSSTGLITAKKDGNVNISVVSASGVTVVCAVTIVQKKVVSIDNIPSTKHFILNFDAKVQTFQLAPRINPSDALDKTLTYASTDTSKATVSNAGLITTKGFGNSDVTVTNPFSGVKSTCKVTVQELVATSISCTPSSFSTTRIGTKFKINTSFVPSNPYNKDLTYATSNSSVVVVENGEGRIRGYGNATITVTNTRSGKSFNIPVVCTYVPVTGIKIIPSRFKVSPGGVKPLEVILSPANHSVTSVEYVSSDANVATVTGDGVVLGHKVGVCYIDCNADNNITTRIYVTVTNLDIALDYYQQTLKLLREAMHDCNETIAQAKADKVQDDIDKVVKPQLDALDKEIGDMNLALGNLEDTLPFLEDGILNTSERKIIQQNFSILQIEEQDVTTEYNRLRVNKYLLATQVTKLNTAYNGYKNRFNRLETVVALLLSGELDAPIDSSLANEYKSIISEMKGLISTYRGVATDCIDAIAKAMANEAENNANEHTNAQITVVDGKIKLNASKITQVGDRVTSAETSIEQNSKRIQLVAVTADQAGSDASYAMSQIEILSDKIVNTVQKNEFSSMLEQNSTSIIMSFNQFSGQSYYFTQDSFDIKRDSIITASIKNGNFNVYQPGGEQFLGSIGLQSVNYTEAGKPKTLYSVANTVSSISCWTVSREYGNLFTPMLAVSGQSINHSGNVNGFRIQKGINCYEKLYIYNGWESPAGKVQELEVGSITETIHNNKLRANMQIGTTKAITPNIESIGSATVDKELMVELPNAMIGAVLDYVVQITNIGDSNVRIKTKTSTSFVLEGKGQVDYIIKGVLPKKRKAKVANFNGGSWYE